MPDIRNIAILADIDAGKTTLAEQLLFACGEIRSPGRVDDGSAHTDSLPVERERGISVASFTVSVYYKGIKINIADTPGHIDFFAETERAIMAVDAAILIVSSVEGLQARTIYLWSILQRRKIPVVVFINKTDRVGSNFMSVLNDLKNTLSQDFVIFNTPVGEGTKSVRIADTVPSDSLDKIAETDDLLLDRYLAGQADLNEFYVKAVQLFRSCMIYPVICGAALYSMGITELLDIIAEFFPSPSIRDTGLSGFVYKVEHDKKMGRAAYIRLFSGELRSRMPVEIRDNVYKISQIKSLSGKSDCGYVGSGDIAAIYGLNGIKTGDFLGNSPFSDIYSMMPLLKVRVLPDDESYYPRLADAVNELCVEDPLLNVEWYSGVRELNISIAGKIQIEILRSIMLSRFGIPVSFSRPSVIYKETPAKSSVGFDAYTMPKPCWAILKFLIEPMPAGYGFSFSSEVPNDKLFYRYQEHVRRALPDALKQGLYGWEVTDLRITLVDGEHHIVHTHPLDFYVCTPMALRNGFVDSGMRLLEPFVTFNINAPKECESRILEDVSDMRGSCGEISRYNNFVYISGEAPFSEINEYPLRLSMLSKGKASINSSFIDYRPCPEETKVSVPYRGVDPLDRAKYILSVRGAIK